MDSKIYRQVHPEYLLPDAYHPLSRHQRSMKNSLHESKSDSRLSHEEQTEIEKEI